MVSVSSQQKQARVDLPGLPLAEWSGWLAPILRELGEPNYRVALLLDWVFRRGANDFSSMTNLPKTLRAKLEENFLLHPVDFLKEQSSEDGTRKFLWKRSQGDTIESVFIPDGSRRTFCISTQAGCPVRCTFCATGFGGFAGQLTSGEIVDQALQTALRMGSMPSNVVFMGMGEPLLNWPNVDKAIEILCHPKQFGLGARRLTVSTVGVPARMVELGRRHPQVKLAVSLHATTDKLRNEIIPLNRQYPLKEVLRASREHNRITGKKVTFEYIILPGVNDHADDARRLGRLLWKIPSRINLIGFNPFPEAQYKKPTVARLLQFRQQLSRSYSGPLTIRRSRGEDIQGACGQLSLTND